MAFMICSDKTGNRLYARLDDKNGSVEWCQSREHLTEFATRQEAQDVVQQRGLEDALIISTDYPEPDHSMWTDTQGRDHFHGSSHYGDDK